MKKIISIIISIICLVSLIFNGISLSKIEDNERTIEDYQKRLNLCQVENKDLYSMKEGLLGENTEYQKTIGELEKELGSCQSELELKK